MSQPGDYARAARAEVPSPLPGMQPAPASQPEAGRGSKPEAGGRSWPEADSGSEPETDRGILSLTREVLGILVTAVVLSILVKTFVVQAFFIPSGSMEGTLHGCTGCLGDRVVVNKLTGQMGGVKRGDIVVFSDTDNWLHPTASKPGLAARARDVLTFIGLAPATSENDLVKRVIGVGGDNVEGRGGQVYVNGTLLDEPYVFSGDRPTEVEFKVTVPPDTLWVMGDHRSGSSDSRFHQQDPGRGFIPVKDVAGRAFAIIWPLDRAGSLDRPKTFDQPFGISAPR